MHKELQITKHRSFPVPDLPWIMSQKWEDIVFLHWPAPAGMLRQHIPDSLELDGFNETAWLGIVLFQVKGMRARGLPSIPILSSFLELNVRTYVKYKGKPGVYFLNLDTDSRLTVKMARFVYSLPYRKAEMNIKREGSGIDFFSKRTQIGKHIESLHCAYQPFSHVYYTKVGTLEHWLTERYCLWTLKGRQLIRADVHHTKWELQKATVLVKRNTMAPFLPITTFRSQPLVHYCQTKRAFFGPPIKEQTIY